MSLTGWLFFLKNPDSVRERCFGLWMCKHKLEQTPFCICQNLNPNTLSSSKLLPSKQRSTKFIFLGLWLCKRKLEQIPVCTCQNPIQTHFHLHSCYPQTKNVPPHLQKQNCTNCVFCSARTGARTVHVQCTVHCTPQCTATKRCKYHGISVFFENFQKKRKHSFFLFSSFLGKYVVFTAFCGRALWRAL